MKKFLIADLVKAVDQELMSLARDRFPFLNESDLEIFVNENPENTWDDIAEVADALGVDITDVTGEDVDNYFDMGGTARGELDSSIGPIQWIYNHETKSYIIYMVLTDTLGKDTDVMYNIPSDTMKLWKSSDSMGEYYNMNIRGNVSLEDPNYACGCTPNPCEQGQIDLFKTRYGSLK